MHIRLPDRQCCLFRPQAFLSEQSLPRFSASCSSAVILLLFIAAISIFTTAVQLGLHSIHFVFALRLASRVFFLLVGLAKILITLLSRILTGSGI